MRCFLVLLTYVSLFAASSAEAASASESRWVTNMGRTVLAQADVVVKGAISKKVSKFAGTWRRELLVQEILWGYTKRARIMVLYHHEGTFSGDDAGVALALRRVAGGGNAYEMIGGRTRINNESDLSAIKAWIALEKSPLPLVERAETLRATIKRELKAGGVHARFAAVELLYMVRHHPQALNHEDYAGFLKQADRSPPLVRGDVRMAMAHLVSSTLKPAAQIEALRAKDQQDRVRAVQRLEGYLAQFPSMFSMVDADRCEMLSQRLPTTSWRRVSNMEMKIRTLSLERERKRDESGIISRGTGGTINNLSASVNEANLLKSWTSRRADLNGPDLSKVGIKGDTVTTVHGAADIEKRRKPDNTDPQPIDPKDTTDK